MVRDADSARNHGEFHCFKIPPSLGRKTLGRIAVGRRAVSITVRFETGQFGADQILLLPDAAVTIALQT